MPWFAAARFACAHASDGVFGVKIGGPRTVYGRGGRAIKWFPLLLLVMTALAVRNYLPAWGVMWALAYAIYFGCKWLTLWDGAPARASIRRRLGYLFAWPGMDARAFFAARRRPEEPPPRELSAAVIKTNLGLALLYLAAPLAVAHRALLGGWLAMIGLILFLHFGLFDLFWLAWRSFGVNAKPLMASPWRSRSLGEFWGSRWNRGFRELSHTYLFRPLVARVGATRALFVTFVASGLIHDAVISLPARGGYGLPTLYFAVQAVGLLVERSRFGRGHLRGIAGRLFTIALTALPAPLLFHPPFVHRVMLPFLDAIGAT
jgi:alginate O-acetyltransferase complex protein AlgI